MHWVLDVNFREDDSRTRERTLGNNLSWLRRFAVTLLKRHPVKDSLRGKMIRCMMNTEFLLPFRVVPRFPWLNLPTTLRGSVTWPWFIGERVDGRAT